MMPNCVEMVTNHTNLLPNVLPQADPDKYTHQDFEAPLQTCFVKLCDKTDIFGGLYHIYIFLFDPFTDIYTSFINTLLY